MSACDSRNGSVFTALETHHQTVTWSAHLAVSQVQDPFILESKQLPLIYSLMPRGSIEVPCVHSGPWAGAGGPWGEAACHLRRATYNVSLEDLVFLQTIVLGGAERGREELGLIGQWIISKGTS